MAGVDTDAGVDDISDAEMVVKDEPNKARRVQSCELEPHMRLFIL